MKKSFDDGIGFRGRRHKNFIIFQGQALKFEGKSLPGCRVLREGYTKNGKWSHSTWECELCESITALIITQDWETGKWFPEQTWEAVCSRHDLTGLADPESFVRVYFPQNACRLDEERASVPDTEILVEAFAALVKAQADLTVAQTEKNRLEYEAKKVSDLQIEIDRAVWETQCHKQESERLKNLLAQSEKIEHRAKEVAQELKTAETELFELVRIKETEEYTAEMQKRTEVLRSVKGKKMSLAELQAMMKNS